MIAGYASRTGGARNLDALRRSGWRLLVSAKGVHRSEGFPYAIDNGAWHCHVHRKPFDFAAFDKVVALLGAGADWIVAPDIVAGGRESLALSTSFLPRLVPIAPVLVAVQDGMEPADVWTLLGGRIGIFVGGTTEWKLRTLPAWGELARLMRCHLHVGRVNSERRIRYAASAGAHSFDGSSASLYSKTLPLLEGARHLTIQELLKW